MNEALHAKKLSESIDRLLKIDDSHNNLDPLDVEMSEPDSGLGDPELLQFAQRLVSFNVSFNSQPDSRVRRRLRLRLFESLLPSTAFGTKSSWDWRWWAYYFQWRSPLAPAMLVITLLFLGMGWSGSSLYRNRAYPTFQALQVGFMAPVVSTETLSLQTESLQTTSLLDALATNVTFAPKLTQSTPAIPIATPALGTPRPIPVPVPEQLGSFHRNL